MTLVVSPLIPPTRGQEGRREGPPPSLTGAAAGDGPGRRPRAVAGRGPGPDRRVGRTPPEWFEATPLEYPKSLDLAWPEPPPGPWNNQKNVGQYVWDVINPNPARWRQGVRLMHHLLVLHKDDVQARTRVMTTLGRLYFSLLQDHARAAFWWRKAGVHEGRSREGVVGVFLAECYWRLGNRAMAVELLGRLPPRFESIKLWADLGELEKALGIAESFAKGRSPETAYLYAGDACRVAGRFAEAVRYYRKALAVPATELTERSQKRARSNVEAIELFELSDVARVPDGTYRASSLGYEAPVAVEVVVRERRLASVRVTEHREKQFYSALTDTPARIIAKQGVKGVDATSGATITSDAIINATAKALAGPRGEGRRRVRPGSADGGPGLPEDRMRLDLFLPMLRKPKAGVPPRRRGLLYRAARRVLPGRLFSDPVTKRRGLARRALGRLGPSWLAAPARRLVQATCFLAFLWLFFFVCWPYGAARGGLEGMADRRGGRPDRPRDPGHRRPGPPRDPCGEGAARRRGRPVGGRGRPTSAPSRSPASGRTNWRWSRPGRGLRKSWSGSRSPRAPGRSTRPTRRGGRRTTRTTWPPRSGSRPRRSSSSTRW